MGGVVPLGYRVGGVAPWHFARGSCSDRALPVSGRYLEAGKAW